LALRALDTGLRRYDGDWVGDNHNPVPYVIQRHMIVCSCSMITAKEVAEAVTALRTADPLVVLTPGTIYRYLGKRPSCGSCLPLISKLMVAYDEEGLSPSGPDERLGVEEP
jgi:bacterioferritin-associated ferredoxin